jgi:DNA-binding beta-propeller fold protein YncE
VLPLPCCTIGVAVGAGALWATRPRQAAGQVLRVDPRSGRITARITVGFGPSAIVVATGNVWVSNTSLQTSLMRIDARTNMVTTTVEVGQGISDLAVGASGLWATENRQTAVRLDPASGRVLRRVGFPDTALQLAVGHGELWASALNCRSCAQGFVTRLNLKTGSAGPPIPVGATPVALTVGGGALWVANFNSGTVTRLPHGSG